MSAGPTACVLGQCHSAHHSKKLTVTKRFLLNAIFLSKYGEMATFLLKPLFKTVASAEESVDFI